MLLLSSNKISVNLFCIAKACRAASVLLFASSVVAGLGCLPSSSCLIVLSIKKFFLYSVLSSCLRPSGVMGSLGICGSNVSCDINVI